MSSKLLVSISLLSLAAFIFAFSAYATCECAADAYGFTGPLTRHATAMVVATAFECSGSYSIWAIVGDDNNSVSNPFSSGALDRVDAWGWIWESPHEAFATIFTSQGCSANKSWP